MMIWYFKMGALMFTALILVPLVYKRLRPNEPSILEGGYPEKKSQASSKFGEFKTSDLPGADLPAFGTSNSTPLRYLEMETENVWIHPDIQRQMKRLKEITGPEEDELE